MNAPRLTAAISLAALLSACSTAASRIRDRQTEFDAYPKEVQEQIRAGMVSPGFTKDQVTIALGRPDRVLERRTAAGATEVWVYGGPPRVARYGFGFGYASTGWDSGLGGNMGLALADDEPVDRVRVAFEKDAVVAVENAVKR